MSSIPKGTPEYEQMLIKGAQNAVPEVFGFSDLPELEKIQAIEKERNGHKRSSWIGKDGVDYRWKGGQVNKAAVQFRKNLRAMLIEEGLRETTDITGENKPRIKRVVERIFDEAEIGEAWACSLIFERVDGKAPLQIQAEQGDTVVMVIRGASTDDL